MEGKSVMAKDKSPASNDSSSKLPLLSSIPIDPFPINFCVGQSPSIPTKIPKSSTTANNGATSGSAGDEVRSNTISVRPENHHEKYKRDRANRGSAQKTRTKKLEYIMELEDKERALETRKAFLTSEFLFHQNKRDRLEMENKNLREQLTIRAHIDTIKIAELEAIIAEVTRLRKLSMQQHIVNTSYWKPVENQPCPEEAKIPHFDLNHLDQDHKLSQLDLTPNLNPVLVREVGGHEQEKQGHNDEWKNMANNAGDVRGQAKKINLDDVLHKKE